MSGVWASSVHNHRVESIQPHHSKVVARLDQILVDINFVDLSFLQIPVNGPFEEFFVGFLHVFGYFRSEKRNFAMDAKATDECFHSGESWDKLITKILTEHISFEASQLQVILGVSARDIES